MKNFKLTLISTLVLGLAACGSSGGGGDGGGSAPAAPTPANETAQNNTTTPTTDTNNNTGSNAGNTADNNTGTDTANNNAGNTATDTANNAGNNATTEPEKDKPVDKPVDQPSTNPPISQDTFIKGQINKATVINNTAKVAELSGYNRKYSFNGTLVKPSNVEEIIVDGTTKLQVVTNQPSTIGGLQGDELASVLNSLYTATKDPQRDLFYFGDETPEADIPKKGIVTYKGNAIRYDNASNPAKTVGTTTLTANFDTKKISGDIAMSGLMTRNISLKDTDIVGNGFKGNATAGENYMLAPTRYGTYEGKFYGPNAEEVAGKVTFAENLKDLNTSFSAEKVE